MPRLTSEHNFKLLADHATDTAMIVMDARGTIVDWSRGAEKLLGWSYDDVVGQPFEKLFMPRDVASGRPRAVLDMALSHARQADPRWHAHKDGRSVFCDGMVSKLLAEDGRTVVGFGKVMREGDPTVAASESDERLRKAQAQLGLAAEAAGLGIWTWDMRYDTGTWENGRMYEIFGVPPDRPIVNAAQLMADYLHPDDVADFQRATRDALQSGQRFAFTGRFRLPHDPDVRWLELTGILAPGDDGHEGGTIAIGTAADITVRKRIEEDLRENRLRVEAALDSGDVATWVLDIQADRILGDDNLNRLFGVPKDEAALAPLSRYVASIHPDDVASVSQQIREAIERDAPYRATYRVTDGQTGYRWITARGRASRDARGQPAILAGVAIDITQQIEINEELRATQERYHTLITSMDEAFGIVRVILDEDGKPADYRFEEINAALEQQSGLVDAAGRTIREMVPDIEPHWIEIYGRVALTREPARFIEHSQAMGYWWDVYATPIGEPEELRIAILFSDVTARLRAEESLRQVAADLSEANRRKTEFLATLAHELRNPLAPMRTGLDLMRLAGKATPASERVMEMMDRQLRQMVHLIDDLMDVSRINSGKIVLKKARVDVGAVVTGAVETVMPALEAAHHRLQVSLPERTVEIEGDPTRLAQILVNLLTNAVKYTPNGGTIALSARVEADAVVVDVADTGIGIPPEEQGGVFDMFSQVSRNMGRAQGGLGIGLSLVRSLVAMHGGVIAVRSAGTGQGTTFTLTLPLPGAMSIEAPASEQAGRGAAAGAKHGLRILVADDNVDAANTLRSLLEVTGHQVEAVHDGVEAVRRIVELKPDLAILDIGMPGQNGYEVARAIRAMPAMDGVMLVALTGWGGELDRNRSEEAGFDAHLTKPAGLVEIDRLITQSRAR